MSQSYDFPFKLSNAETQRRKVYIFREEKFAEDVLWLLPSKIISLRLCASAFDK
jgi:hypothetical protein